MDRDNEIELIETIQEKDRRIKELEAMNETIGRELLARTDELNEVLEKHAKEVEELNKQYDKLTQYFIKNHVAKDKIREIVKKLQSYSDIAEQQINQSTIIADSDSLNYGRKEAHITDIRLLNELLEEEGEHND